MHLEAAVSSAPTPILMTVRELGYGGIERDVTKIALHLDRSRFTPHVGSYAPTGIRFDELSSAGIPILHLPISSWRSATTLSTAMRLRRYIRQHGIRLVHAYDPSAVFVVPIARASQVPAVLSSTLGHRDLFDRRTRCQLRWTDRMVDINVVNCEFMRRHMIADEHFSPERVELCYNGVDTSEFFPQTLKVRDVLGASIVIGTVCVFRPEKAVHLLQQAFASIRHLDTRLKLLLVGTGPELSQLQANSLRLNIHDACHFAPATANVIKFLHAIDIFVLSSNSEAFSNALLEAMACGCSTVASRIGGTPELIGNDERGLLFRSGDLNDLSEKLVTLITNHKLRRLLGSRAAEFARTRLSIQMMSHRMASIYQTALRRRLGLDVTRN